MVNPGEYYYKTSMEHELALDYEEQLMIVQELKDQGLVSWCPPAGTGDLRHMLVFVSYFSFPLVLLSFLPFFYRGLFRIYVCAMGMFLVLFVFASDAGWYTTVRCGTVPMRAGTAAVHVPGIIFAFFPSRRLW